MLVASYSFRGGGFLLGRHRENPSTKLGDLFQCRLRNRAFASSGEALAYSMNMQSP